MQHLIADPSDYSLPVLSFKRNLTAENLKSVHMIEAAEVTGQLKKMESLQIRDQAVMKILRREGIDIFWRGRSNTDEEFYTPGRTTAAAALRMARPPGWTIDRSPPPPHAPSA
ncbi:hypothetical protein SELMODRAFT_407419 [Selaginella moellendorffii]|uniref:Uncharacterized protein n=1 Tax=Selaginella moellendorffii TaxID=88036 RepID=D8R5J3_SELML|nr:hypothetical protein SELMODRAFT_407419 [Selaginella moellendorffii]